MKNRKALVLVLALTLVFGSFSMAFAETQGETPVTTAVPTLYDIGGHWAEAAIAKWSANGVINGFEGQFRPDDSITRGEMAVILDNMMDYQVMASNTFYDVPTGQFYTEAVLKANASGILLGNGIMLRPTDKITREEAAVMLSRAFAVKGTANGSTFDDKGYISSWAREAISGMQAKGYIEGYKNSFMPMTSVSRAEVLTIINNIVKAYYTAAGTYTENVTGTAVIKVSGVILKDMTVSQNLIVSEGVAKGDATFDSVKVLGDMVIRGGGENSIHIIGDNAATSIRIEKIGDRVRVVIADGLTVQEIEVSAGEEIIISGNVGILDISAPGAIINVNDATIRTAIVSGAESSIIVGVGSSIETITASAKVTISGAGDVGAVTLYAGADGSGITTADTEIAVAPGVTKVTGGGGTEIPPGSTGTNDNDGSELIGVVEPIIGGGGGGGGAVSPSLTLGSITGATANGGNTYTVSAAAIEDVSVTVTAANYITATDVTISVEQVDSFTQFVTYTIPTSILNNTHTILVGDLFIVMEESGAVWVEGNDDDIDVEADYEEELELIKNSGANTFIVTITAGTTKSVSFTIEVE